MKICASRLCLGCLVLCQSVSFNVLGQSQAVKQLQLDIQKLAQLKTMLSSMHSGFSILSNGYENIKSQTQSNFNLHKGFIDGLSLVSPAVKNSSAIASIISVQSLIVAEYKAGLRQLKSYGLLNIAEREVLRTAYGSIFQQSVNSLEILQQVITSGKLQMTEAERLKIIGSLEQDLDKQLLSLRNFTSQANQLFALRQKMKRENKVLQNTYGIAK